MTFPSRSSFTAASDQVAALNNWVVGRDTHVAPQYANTNHGTFVAGLLCRGRPSVTAAQERVAISVGRAKVAGR